MEIKPTLALRMRHQRRMWSKNVTINAGNTGVKQF